MTLPTDYKARKDFPLMTFLTAYMPDTMEALVELSRQGNVQHNISTPEDSPFYLSGDRIAWERAKSQDEMETLMRHAWEHERAKRRSDGYSMIDSDKMLHIVKAAWRACAEAQKTIETFRKLGSHREIAPGRFEPKTTSAAPDPAGS